MYNVKRDSTENDAMATTPLSIFDTTLRDGEQAPGNAMSVPVKVEIAKALETLGVDVIETGFPAASKNDCQTTVALAEQIKDAKLCAFTRAFKGDIQTAFDAIRLAKKFQLEILTTVSDIHLEHKRNMSRAEALNEARQAVKFAAALGVEDISIAPEDLTRADEGFLHQMVDVVLEAGAAMIAVPDTVGYCLPHEFGNIIAKLRSWVGDEVRIGVHAHDDLGLATANTLAGIQAGADECQVTLCGIGERAGNAALEEVIAAITSKPEVFHRTTRIKTTQIRDVCSLLAEKIRLPIPRSKAITGANAFATAAGIHQSGLLRNPITYEFVPPERFGAERQLLFTRHSGRHALRSKVTMMGIVVDDDVIDSAYATMLTWEDIPILSDSDIRELIRLAVQKKQAIGARAAS